jgi:hypothetical protein
MKLSIRNIALLALMLLSAGLGAALRPTISLADERPPIRPARPWCPPPLANGAKKSTG